MSTHSDSLQQYQPQRRIQGRPLRQSAIGDMAAEQVVWFVRAGFTADEAAAAIRLLPPHRPTWQEVRAELRKSVVRMQRCTPQVFASSLEDQGGAYRYDLRGESAPREGRVAEGSDMIILPQPTVIRNEQSSRWATASQEAAVATGTTCEAA